MARKWVLPVCASGVILALSLLLATAALAQDGVVHVVRRGDTVGALAGKYGVTAEAIVRANRLTDRRAIYAGQRLCIPMAGGPSGCPDAPIPPESAIPPEEIVILSPAQGITITSPITVTGLVTGQARSIVAVVLDGSAGEIGRAYGAAGRGEPAVFSVSVPFTVTANSQGGRIQVWSVSALDGAVEHLSSVKVQIQGAELDPLLVKLAAAIAARDYDGLRALMADPFQISEFGGPKASLPADQALRQLRQRGLDAGAARLDFSVSARELLRDRIDLGSDILHVVYSTGWGANGTDGAFLLIAQVAGRARWVEWLYAPGGIDPH